MLNTKIIKTINKLADLKEFKENPCFYLYDSNDIDEKLQLISKRPNNVLFFYAMKANSNKKILKHIRSNSTVNGVEIASVGELEKALEFFKPDEIIYTGPGKTKFELTKSVVNQIKLINLESIIEAHRINEEAKIAHIKSVDILVRINTNYHLDEALANMTGVSTKMGIDQDAFLESFSEIAKLPKLNIKGIHVFSASGVLNYLDLLKYVEYVFSYVKTIEKSAKKTIEIIDFGGGFGIDYSGKEQKFETNKFFKELKNLIKKFGFGQKKLILELGRYVVGESGYYVAEIIDIKKSKGKKHIVAAGGVNHLRLPSASGVNQPVYIVKRNVTPIYKDQPVIDKEIIDIGGPLCFSEDKIAQNVKIDHAEIGDLVVISKTGAYGYSVSSLELLSHPLPPEYLINCKS